jgi:hypothetical protein
MTDEFINRCVSSAADLALLFVGEPYDKMFAALCQTRENLSSELSASFGPEVALLIAEAFVAAVVGRKAELERGAAIQERTQLQ